MSTEGSAGIPRRTFLQGVAAGALGLGLSGSVARDLLAEEESGGMRTRTLGRTGLETSVICWGGGGTRPEHLRLLQAAWEKGVNFYDVAWGYQGGQAERGVGELLATLPDREKAYVCTKASGFRRPSGSARRVYEAFRDAVRQSLERLRTDYVDVMMWPHGASSPSFTRDEAMQDAFRQLRDDGLVKHFGFSSHTNYVSTCQAGIDSGFYDVFMTVVNVCTQNPDAAGSAAGGGRRGRGVEDTRALLRSAKEKDIGVIAMKVANPGYLTPATDDLLAEAFPDDSGLSRHQRLYAYGLQQEGVSCVNVGIRSVQHLQEAVAIGTA